MVRLAGGRTVVVDAKVPLDAFLEATATDEPELREAHLARHARQLRGHIELLGSKRYWRSLPETPEFVVLFLPAESFLAAGLDADGTLIEYAADQGVVLASPTTLIALLRTVAHGWRHESLADQAREIHRIGRDLHERLRTMGTHLGKLGRALDTAVGAYNQTVGSWESRVLVAARRFEDLGATDDVLESPPQVESAVRAVGTRCTRCPGAPRARRRRPSIRLLRERSEIARRSAVVRAPPLRARAARPSAPPSRRTRGRPRPTAAPFVLSTRDLRAAR